MSYLVCKDIKPIYESSNSKAFFSTVQVVSSAAYILTISFFKNIYIISEKLLLAKVFQCAIYSKLSTFENLRKPHWNLIYIYWYCKYSLLTGNVNMECFSSRIANDMLSCEKFRKFQKVYKSFSEVNKKRYHQQSAGESNFLKMLKEKTLIKTEFKKCLSSLLKCPILSLIKRFTTFFII